MLFTSFDPFTLELDRFARRAFGVTNGNGAKARTIIPMDAIRRKDEVLLRFDLPGVDPKSIDVTVDRNVLKVSAQRTEESVEGENAITRERVTGSFVRRVYLGDALDSAKIEASYANGVLAVRLPLLEKAQPRKIEIHTDSKKKITA